MALLPDRVSNNTNDIKERFENYFGGFPPFNISAFLDTKKPLVMLVDVYESDEYVVAICDVPGIEKKEDMVIDVIDARHLKVSAKRVEPVEYQEKRITQNERIIGNVDRVITLPADVILEKTEASYKNGVLRVQMPKKIVGLEPKVDVKFEG